jgi:hypothetical protein
MLAPDTVAGGEVVDAGEVEEAVDWALLKRDTELVLKLTLCGPSDTYTRKSQAGVSYYREGTLRRKGTTDRERLWAPFPVSG